MKFKEIRCKGVDWTHVAQDRVHCTLVNMVMNLQVPENMGSFFTSWVTSSLSRRPLLCGIS